jgi:hypothetical protein
LTAATRFLIARARVKDRAAMPIVYHIDHARRLVIARGKGVFTEPDVLGYQQEVWSRPEVAGYDELVDMTAVERIVVPLPVPVSVLRLATTSAAMDPLAQTSKLAIVAPEQHAFGLGRMYQSFRELDPRSTKQVAVFRTLEQALAYLDIDGLEEEGTSGQGR